MYTTNQNNIFVISFFQQGCITFIESDSKDFFFFLQKIKINVVLFNFLFITPPLPHDTQKSIS